MRKYVDIYLVGLMPSFLFFSISRLYFAVLLLPWYLLVTMSFLNDLYKEGVLFSWQERTDGEGVKLFFFMDVFDIFWLILAPIPNALFAQSYRMEVYPLLFGWQKWVFNVTGLCLALAAYIWVCVATIGFAENKNNWTARIERHKLIYDKYNALEWFNTIMFSIEAICVVWCIGFGLWDATKVSASLAVHTLVAAVILFVYWIMLILSGIANRMILGDTTNSEPLFSMPYCILGVVAVLAIAMSVHLFSLVPVTDLVAIDTYKFIIGSIVVPCIPIATQLMQILLPKRKNED